MVEDRNLADRVSRIEGQIDVLLQGHDKADKESADNGDIPEQLEKWVKVVAATLGAVAGMAGLFYAAGYIVVNLHMLQYGIRLYGLNRPNYLVSGVLTVVVHLLVLGLPVAIVAHSNRSRFSREKEASLDLRWLPSAVGLPIITGPGLFLTLAALVLVPDYRVVGEEIGVMEAYAGLLGALGISIAITAGIYRYPLTELPEKGFLSKVHNALDIPMLAFLGRFVSAIILVSIISLIILIWSWFVYPQISHAFGGGRPVAVQIMLSTDEDASFDSAQYEALGIAVANGVTEPIELLDESENALVLLTPGGAAVQLDRSAVKHITYLPPPDD